MDIATKHDALGSLGSLKSLVAEMSKVVFNKELDGVRAFLVDGDVHAFLVDGDELTPKGKELERHARDILEGVKGKELDVFVHLYECFSIVNDRVRLVKIELVPLSSPWEQSDYEIQKEKGVCALIVRQAGCKYAFFAGAILPDEVARISCGAKKE